MDTTSDAAMPQTQSKDTAQGNDQVIQPQQTPIPAAAGSSDLQRATGDLNTLPNQTLKVQTDGVVPANTRQSNTLLTVSLVAVILIAAAALFIASMRVDKKSKKVLIDDDEIRPSIAPGAETNSSLGGKKAKKKSKKRRR